MNYLRMLSRRLLVLAMTVWAAATINFILPKVAPGNPVAEVIAQASMEGRAVDMTSMVKAYEEKFGLGRPVFEQYVTYLGDIARLDLGYSISAYPARVWDLISEALPWTVGLLLTATLIAFATGSVFGAMVAWPHAPRWIKRTAPGVMLFSAIPYYLIGLVLIYLLSFRLKAFPTGGGHSVGVQPGTDLSSWLDIMYHAVLPASSIVIASIGTWAISMRSLMVSNLGEDYMNFGEARGLRRTRLFWQYAVRNSLLPQVTALGLSLSHIVSGAILVEVIFSYPGIGSLLLRAVTVNDYFLIYGISLVIIVTIALTMLVLELVYPLLDPRIRTEGPHA
jgi:peptide/nickel transport system permease protein